MNANQLHLDDHQTGMGSATEDDRLPESVLLQWPGRLPRFSRALEGGPGKPQTLIVMVALAFTMAWQGIRILDHKGIDSTGPAFLLLGGAWLLLLLFWVLIKAGLRHTSVVFYVTEHGVGIMPSARQRSTDRRLGLVMWLVFLITFKGGQWSEWHPFTRWREARRMEANDLTKQLLISGGAWDVRLFCSPENYDQVKQLIRQRLQTAKANCVFKGIEPV